MNELIYDRWHFPRETLAKSYLEHLLKGSGAPIALQCPRRWGKTTFLLQEMSQAAVDAGFLCVYIDVWQHRSDVLAAINYGLQEALDDLEVPESTVGKRLKTTVKKVAVGPLGMDFGEEPARRRPDSPYLLVDWLLKTLTRLAAKPVLLLFDEIQEVAVSSEGENIVSALRAAITKSAKSVRVIFTGSNQERLRQLFAKSRAALYEGASIIDFPRLDDDFLTFISQQAVQIFRRRIPVADLKAAFERFQFQPRALIDLVFLYASSPNITFNGLLDSRIDAIVTADIARPQFDALTPLQRQIASRLAAGGEVSSLEARRSYAKSLRRKAVSPGSINNALKALVQKHIISKPVGSHGGYTFDDPAIREWLRVSANALPKMSHVRHFAEPADETMRDNLTGARNRRYFEKTLRTMMQEASRLTLPLTLILIDLDHLKSINDAHGHLVGDNVLKWTAERIAPLLRPLDVLSRFGGGKFAILLADTPSTQGVGVAEQICADVGASPSPVPNDRVTVTVSCGVATSSAGGLETAEQLLAGADEALYRAKGQGRNCVQIASP
jgi:diguanylate cyclase (GGDEF)-like protein